MATNKPDDPIPGDEHSGENKKAPEAINNPALPDSSVLQNDIPKVNTSIIDYENSLNALLRKKDG